MHRDQSAAQRLERRVALAVVVLPLLGSIAALGFAWKKGVSPLDIYLCISLYLVTSLGVTAGFHRLFTHGSFSTTGWVRVLLVVAGSMSAQGPLLFWVAAHRRHHQQSDQSGDPHSPQLHGPGISAYWRGFWHAHIGWMFRHDHDDWGRYVPDLLRDRMIFNLDRGYFLWVGLGVLLPSAIGGVLSGTWMGALTGGLWGGLVRLFLLHHTTWSVNSICHLIGTRPYLTHDQSANHPVCAFFTLGEGWHNNHHAFPTSARHGLAWWEVDMTYWVIRALQSLGLAWDVKYPDTQALEKKRRLSQPRPLATSPNKMETNHGVE